VVRSRLFVVEGDKTRRRRRSSVTNQNWAYSRRRRVILRGRSASTPGREILQATSTGHGRETSACEEWMGSDRDSHRSTLDELAGKGRQESKTYQEAAGRPKPGF